MHCFINGGDWVEHYCLNIISGAVNPHFEYIDIWSFSTALIAFCLYLHYSMLLITSLVVLLFDFMSLLGKTSLMMNDFTGGILLKNKALKCIVCCYGKFVRPPLLWGAQKKMAMVTAVALGLLERSISVFCRSVIRFVVSWTSKSVIFSLRFVDLCDDHSRYPNYSYCNSF